MKKSAKGQEEAEYKTTQQALQESERKLRLISENSRDIICLHAADHRYLYISPACKAVLGFEPQELIGTNPWELVHPEDIEKLRKASQLEASGDQPVILTYRIRKKSGEYIWFDSVSRMLQDDGGKITGFVTTSRNVTSRMLNQERLRLNELYLQELLDMHRRMGSTQKETLDSTLQAVQKILQSRFAFIGFLSADEAVMTIPAWSQEVMEQCSVSNKPVHYPIAGAGLWGEVVRQRRPVVVNDYQTTNEFKKGYPAGHVPIKRFLSVPVISQGKIVVVGAVANKEKEYDATDIQLLSSFLHEMWNLLEHRRIAQALEKSEFRFRTVARLSSDFAYSCIHLGGEGYKVDWITDAFYTLSGYSESELKEQGCWLFTVHPDDRESATEPLRRLRPGESDTREFRLLTKSGYIISVINFMECQADPQLPGGLRLYGAVRDITEYKEMDRELTESETRYRRLFESAKDGILIIDAGTGFIIDVNPFLVDLLGFSKEYFLGRALWEISIFKDILANKDKFIELSQFGYLRYEDLSLRTADGRQVDVEFVSNVYHDDQMKVIQCNIRDISKRKQAEGLFRTLAMHSPLGIYIASRGKFLYTNPQFCRDTGYSEYELTGKETLSLVVAEDRQRVREAAAQMLQGKHVQPYEFRVVRKNGDIRWSLESVASLQYQGERVTIGSYQDVTVRKQMQEQLIVNERMASIGQLVSGIAHELNNPLTGILGFTELLLHNADLPDDAKKDLNIIREESNRMAGIIKGLLAFARKQKAEKENLDINSLIQGILQLRSHEHKISNIQVNKQLDPKLPRIFGNSGQLQQVFINLIVNAEQSMLAVREGGVLTIATEQVGGTVKIVVKDDGQGINTEAMRKIFTPFYTTKEVGKGTGLGLSICHGIISEHGGKITVLSEPGHGATFVVELPVKN